jgi:hypothetical protein
LLLALSSFGFITTSAAHRQAARTLHRITLDTSSSRLCAWSATLGRNAQVMALREQTKEHKALVQAFLLPTRLMLKVSLQGFGYTDRLGTRRPQQKLARAQRGNTTTTSPKHSKPCFKSMALARPPHCKSVGKDRVREDCGCAGAIAHAVASLFSGPAQHLDTEVFLH